jgi:predicted ATPase
MPVTEIYIDGYKNISKTTLRLNEPITVLLAPNNFGKTNVINAIEFAAMIVNTISRRQGLLIRRNGYTSNNANGDQKSPKSFSFGIAISHHDKRIKYSFKVSPLSGIESEVLEVGHAKILSRTAAVGFIQGEQYPSEIDLYSLFISTLLYINNTGKKQKYDEVAKYTELVRDVFFNMSDMLCNRQSMTIHMRPNEKINAVEFEEDIASEAYKLNENHPDRFVKFRNVFVKLFPYIKTFRIVEVHYGEGDNEPIPDRPDAYRLEFDSVGKQRPELFRHLSEGTRDIFLLLLTIFIKQNKPFLAIEEIENGIHPSLYRKVLNLLADTCKDVKILVTTHSPSVVRNFDDRSFSAYYIGVPNDKGSAGFATFKDAASSEIRSKTTENGTSAGELIFDMMSGTKDDIRRLKGWLDV